MVSLLIRRDVKCVRVDGQVLPSNRVPLFGDGPLHEVQVEMG